MRCHGNGDDHCCWIAGQVCEHLEEGTVAGRRWACGLLRQHGTWAKVHALPIYEPVRARLRDAGVPVDCGDWPQKLGVEQCCWEDG